ncbi:TetR family transcriptional regulator [Cryptosporangium sp. NPDC051539]|uniref:TetR/AcrR family transcriptional regulator n=1 Tax=Cryptosporangium sp. NPDC051539 TaxID=3363962 RepID=UPI0037B670C0
MTDITGLRERRRLATAAEIEAAAFALFERQGSEHTTVDDIAAAAGVSPRTFFRYFPTKEDAVLGVKRSFFDAVSDFLPSGDLTFGGLAGATASALGAFSAGEHAPLRLMMRVRCLCKADGNLRSASLVLDAEQCRSRQQGAGSVRARLVVETVSVVLNAALDEWATRRVAGEDADVADVFRSTCALQRGLLRG